MPCPFGSNAVTAVASSATALSSICAGFDAKRMMRFHSGDTSARSSNTAPPTAAAAKNAPLSACRAMRPVAPNPNAKLNRNRGEAIVHRARLATPCSPCATECCP